MKFIFEKNFKKHNYINLYITLVVMMICPGYALVNDRAPGPRFFNMLSDTSVEVLVDGQMAGSGAFVSPDGYVLTAGHYITRPGMTLEVLSLAHGRHPAALIAIDKGHDIALLKIETDEKLPFLTVSRQSPRIGQTIYVVGSPLNRHGLLQYGMLASQQPDYEYLDEGQTQYYVQIRYISAMSPRGLSGGNWVNSRGEIVGVQSGWIDETVAGTNGKSNSGIAFIAPQEAIHRLVQTKKNADTPSLGGIIEELWTQAPGFQERFGPGTEGIVIHQVKPGGPLEKAGLAHEDLIVAADEKKVRYRRELMDIVRSKKVGDTLEISYIKPDNKETVTKDIVLDGLERNWLKQTKEKK